MSHLILQVGSLLESNAKYIAHQTNCVTSRASHLAAAIFGAFPHADIYKPRSSGGANGIPGTIIVSGDGSKHRYVINMMGQYYPGKSKFPDSRQDGLAARKRYFFSCLKEISKIEGLESIAFPYGIGCGSAGGSWEEYHKLLDKFATFMAPKATVTLVKLPSEYGQR